MTAPTPDAVAQARGKLFRDLVQFYDRDGDTAAADKYVVESVDALIAAVREALAYALEWTGENAWNGLCDSLGINPDHATCPQVADALLRSAPLPADAERDAREAAWFRWLRDNPHAAAFTAVNVAKWVPAGPDLGATMASGTVVGEMEDAKNPEYRYHIAASSLPADVQAVAEKVVACGPIAKGARLMLGSGTKYDGMLVGSHVNPLTFGEVRAMADFLLAHLTREAR